MGQILRRDAHNILAVKYRYTIDTGHLSGKYIFLGSVVNYNLQLFYHFIL